ncbi:unnamed protein product [Rodentolepis nana]|uniref:ADP-dependent glucokinase n=1 Tax=Rodentolepis nana TaxID=102285 RepID=A0A0R3TJH8_RODNA|nr:unnamed protein product [Rodentolepis nana]
MSGYNKKYYIFGLIFAVLAIAFSYWFRKPADVNVESVLSSLTRLETAYHAFPQPGPGPLILVGFGGCTDITVNAITFLESLGVSSTKTSQHSNRKGNLEIELNSLEDIVDEFTQMRYVHNKELFDSLVFQAIAKATNSDELRKDGKRGYLSLGGNAPVMASRLAREGADVALAARLSAKESQALPPNIKGFIHSFHALTFLCFLIYFFIVLSAPSSFGLPSIPQTDFHLVMEFDKGSSWRNFTAPRANRYILIRDEENPRLSSLWPDLLSSWLNRGDVKAKDASTSYPDLFVLGGLQTMDNAVISPDIRGERLEALKHFLSVKLPRATLVHFEMASFVETAFVSNLTRTILPYVDSIGNICLYNTSTTDISLNEQELPNLRSLLIEGRIASQASESTPRAAVMLDGMREIWSAMTDSSQLPKVGIGLRRLSRLHLHTLGYQIIMVRRPAGGVDYDPEMIARAMKDPDLVFTGKATELGFAWPYTKAAVAKASLIAHRHTCASANVDPDLTRLLMDESFAVTANPARWPSALHCDSGCNVPRIKFNSTSPVSCWFEDEPSAENKQNERSTRVEICVAPVPVCRRVIRTVGGGDNISAAALRTQVIGRRSFHGDR